MDINFSSKCDLDSAIFSGEAFFKLKLHLESRVHVYLALIIIIIKEVMDNVTIISYDKMDYRYHVQQSY